jgi:excisionase family DNA binding protein
MRKMDSVADTGDYLSTREAAERLGVAVRTVQLWVESGVLRAWKTAGGHRRITRESLEALLAKRSAAVAAAPADPVGDPENRAFRILVVEDDAALRMLFEMTLTSWDLPVEVAVAENGFAGLLRLGAWRPDLLITDLNMPGMDGFRMISHLRESLQWRDLPIIVVTALGPREVEARGGLPEDVRLLAKPVPFGELEWLVRSGIALRAPVP